MSTENFDGPNPRDYVKERVDGFDCDYTFIDPDGNEIGCYYDSNSVDAPEDLIFHRAIGEVFDAGFEIGYKAAMKEMEQKDA